MGTCVTSFLSGGRQYVVVQSPQPADLSTCAGVVVSGSEYAALNASAAFWQPMDIPTATAIAAPILTLFAVAWGFRTIAEFINSKQGESES